MGEREKMTYRAIWCTGLAMSALWPTMVLAQDAAKMQADTGSIQEIVVTAQRREESLQKVPISVSAISGSDAAMRGVTDTALIQTSVPGLEMTREENSSTPFLRGVGSTNGQVGTEPSVATYVDNVYVGTGQAALFSFNNIERVEVLRGPQGTLFGRNATGGVINIITRDPTNDSKLDANIGYSNYNTFDGAFYGSTGLTDDLSANLAAYGHKQNDGWGRNVTTGQAVYKGYDQGLRGKLKWRAGDRTTVLLSGDYNKSRSEEGMNFVIAPGAVGIDGSTYKGGFSPEGGSIDRSIVEQYGTALKIDHDMDWASLSSISSYRVVDSDFTLDQDATPLPVVDAIVNQSNKTFTQELQVLSPKGSALDWIVGAYYYNDNSAFVPLVIQNLLDIYARQKTGSIAGYVQATDEILPDTDVTGGLRYTRDQRSVHGVLATNSEVPIPGTEASQSTVFSKLTYRASIDHHFGSDITAYASYNRGFKSGVYNLLSYTAAPVKPEVLDAFEVGVKSDLLNRHLRLNASLFTYDYSQIQITQIVAGSTKSINAGRARISGGELELVAAPTTNFKVTGGLSVLDGRYSEFDNGPFNIPNPAVCGNPPVQTGPATGGNLQCPVNLAGKTAVRAPALTFNLAADWGIPTSIGRFDLNASLYSNSGFYWEPDNKFRQPAYRLVNTAIQWTEPGGHYYIRAWAKNLFNAYYSSYAFETTLETGTSPAPPRTYGFTLGYSL